MHPLTHQIQALREALGKTHAADAATRESLHALQHDIELYLEKYDHRTLAERLEKLAVRFEADHPAVGTALRQAIDALAKAGM
jgi:hypothetical protein